MLLIIGLFNLNLASLSRNKKIYYSAKSIYRIALTKIGNKDKRINSYIIKILHHAKGKRRVMRIIRRLANKMKHLMSHESKNYMKIRKLAARIIRLLFRYNHSHLNYKWIYHYVNSIYKIIFSKMKESKKILLIKNFLKKILNLVKGNKKFIIKIRNLVKMMYKLINNENIDYSKIKNIAKKIMNMIKVKFIVLKAKIIKKNSKKALKINILHRRKTFMLNIKKNVNEIFLIAKNHDKSKIMKLVLKFAHKIMKLVRKIRLIKKKSKNNNRMYSRYIKKIIKLAIKIIRLFKKKFNKNDKIIEKLAEKNIENSKKIIDLVNNHNVVHQDLKHINKLSSSIKQLASKKKPELLKKMKNLVNKIMKIAKKYLKDKESKHYKIFYYIYKYARGLKKYIIHRMKRPLRGMFFYILRIIKRINKLSRN